MMKQAFLFSKSHIRFVFAMLFVASTLSSVAHAEKGDASVRFEYQFVRTGAFDSAIGEIDIGNTDSHVFMFSGDYAVTDKWTVSASLPWIKKRHQGALPHNPALELTAYPQADQSLIDDGNFHSDWQDLYLAVSYAAIQGDRWSVYPFVSAGVPTNDYPFYAHAAAGRNIWHVPVGAAFSFTPYFSDFSFSGDAAYVFTEKSVGVDISHWLINLDASYYVTPSFAPKVFLSIKHGTKGLGFPGDFDLNALNDEAWYYHDRTIKHNFMNGGIGFDWVMNDKYVVSGSWLTMLNPDQVNIVDFGFSLGITRYFSGN
jgi:hypothetical protein